MEQTNPEIIQSAYEEALAGADNVPVSRPGLPDVVLTGIEIDSEHNAVRVWTTADGGAAPDYVIVNPPVQVVSRGVVIDDPLGAVAVAITGDSRR